MLPGQSKIEEIRSLSRGIVREFGVLKNFCGDSEVSPAEAHILLEIYTRGFMTLKDLSNILSLDKSTLSRTIKNLINKKLLKINKSDGDNRYKYLSLNKEGEKQVKIINCKYNNLVGKALSSLNHSEIENLLIHLKKFYKSLRGSRLQGNIHIRELKKIDEKFIREIIKSSIAELGETEEELILMCPEINYLYDFYKKKRSKYFVAESDNVIVGGLGIAPLKDSSSEICELQKMYISPQFRGIGLGKILLEKCLEIAREFKYKKIFLDTREDMVQAMNLYRKFGFKEIKKPLGSTGHFLCGKYFVYDLKY